ncbi:MAG: hypothetical protein R3325_01150 [Thermoanaerobaculia bacterium]|nr:hypothetical protein [Thermoanaerobaculia bacterium]
MRKRARLLTLLTLVVLLGACESRTDRTDSGGVTLSISDFNGLPLRVGVNGANGLVQVDQITVDNLALDPTGAVSPLMNVEIHSYEVTYTRADRGSRVPVPLVAGLFGVAPVNGTFTVDNLPVMGADQFNQPPLSDLFFQNGGFDKETGDQLVSINFRLRFFGRTISGDPVQSNFANFKVEFVP